MPDNKESMFYKPLKKGPKLSDQDIKMNSMFEKLSKPSFEDAETLKSKDGQFMYMLPDDHPEKKALMDLTKKYKVSPEEIFKDMQMIAPSVGKNGDDRFILANPEEEALLKSRGGAGEPHPLFPSVKQYFSEGDGTNGQGQEDGGVGTSAAAGAPNGGVTASPTEAPDTSISVNTVPGTTPGVNSDGQAPAEGPDEQAVMDTPPAPMVKPSPSKTATTSAIGRAIGVMFGMSPGISPAMAHMGAQAIGTGIAAVTGATAQGAADGEAAVGTGGQSPGSQGQGGIGGGQSNNSQGPGGDGNPASFDEPGLMSLAPGAQTPRPRQQRNNILTYAMGLLPTGMM